MGGASMYDPDQLRTFLAVAQSLSFTQAAERLGIRQPTVSQHVRKLETAVGRPLFVRDTRTVTLTADGEAMAGFARTILAAHEEAAGYFTGSELRGRLRFGVTDDLALTPLPKILRDFRQLYPRIDLELTVAQSPNLLRRVESGHLDLAYVKHGAGGGYEPNGRLVRRDSLVWAGIAGTRIAPDGPVPLVTYQAPSLSRSLGVQSLEQAGRTCRITCIVRGVNGVLAAVRAGLGIAIFARSLMPADLVEPPPSAGLPELPPIDLVLITNPRAAKEPAEALTAAILGSTSPLKPDAG
ncbi:LysR substrate-binding domain-containing protein [Kribbella jejuensis]|nr:LysR substrate-binding domain-containing protein [Kribbella jejuensis]